MARMEAEGRFAVAGEGLHVLVVDKEPAIRRFLRTSLTAAGHEVYDMESGAEALRAIVKERPDILILDLDLPDMEGIEVIRRLRDQYETPVIVLSERDQELEKIEALDAGADDYVTKPFGMGELMARMRGVHRRRLPSGEKGIIALSEDVQIDLVHRCVNKGDRDVGLTPTEFELLKMLVQDAGRVITHHRAIQRLWSKSQAEAAHLLRVNISNLRKKIENDPTRPRLILTEPGVGYRLKIDE